MINFEQYLIERKSSSAGQQVKRKVNIEQLKQMIANKDSDIADVDVSDIIDMSYLFKNSDFGGSWTADLSGWDTSNVEDMQSMFNGCTNLKEVSLPHTENVMNMSNMFLGCTSLKEVSLPHTENVKNMWNMFAGCKNLLQDFSSWNITNVKDKYNMFKGCTKMEDAYKDGKRYYPKGYK